MIDLEKIFIKALMESNLGKDINKALKNGFDGEAELSIKKVKNGFANLHVEGNMFSILIALASLEKSILKKYDVPKELWEIVKERTGCIGVNNE